MIRIPRPYKIVVFGEVPYLFLNVGLPGSRCGELSVSDSVYSALSHYCYYGKKVPTMGTHHETFIFRGYFTHILRGKKNLSFFHGFLGVQRKMLVWYINYVQHVFQGRLGLPPRVQKLYIHWSHLLCWFVFLLETGPLKHHIYVYIPGTLNNQFLMDVWLNNHFPCKDFESSN